MSNLFLSYHYYEIKRKTDYSIDEVCIYTNEGKTGRHASSQAAGTAQMRGSMFRIRSPL